MGRRRQPDGVEGAAVVEYLLVAFAIATLIALVLVAVGGNPPARLRTACPVAGRSVATTGGAC